MSDSSWRQAMPHPEGGGLGDVLRIFPFAFTLSSLLVFVAPFVKGVDLVFDPTAYAFVGIVPKVLVLLPLLFVAIAQVFHSMRRAPLKWAVVLSLAGSGACLLVAGDLAMAEAEALSGVFRSTDCSSSQFKRELEQEWLDASAFHSNCVADARLPQSTLIQACPGYSVELSRHEHWSYFEYLETQKGCAGWCEPAVPLWAYGDRALASCSVTVSEILSTKIHWLGMQEFFMGLVLVLLTFVGLVALGPSIRAKGIDW